MKSSNENDVEEENGDRVVFFVGGRRGNSETKAGEGEKGARLKILRVPL